MPSHNVELARIFQEMSSIYQYLGGNERFRALAYQKASRTIGGLQENIETYFRDNTLEEISGIGSSIAEKIREFLKTGKIKKYEVLRKKVPYGLMDLMHVKGFGPGSLKVIHDTLHINTKEEFIDALQKGKISTLKGFGPKKVDVMLRGLKLHKTVEERMLLWDAWTLGTTLVEKLRNTPGVKNIELAGSLRRRSETIGDIDILISCASKDRIKIINAFTLLSERKQVLARGETKASIILKQFGRQADLRIVDVNQWGSALQYFTGSKEHNIHLRTIARQKGYKINEYGLFRNRDGKRIAGETEEDLYSALNFQWMPPEIREDRGEIELAARHRIPALIENRDIRGDMHTHSNWSDGLLSIEKLAHFVTSNYPYEYIVLTDHSKTERIAGGMDTKEFAKQLKAIRKLNATLGKEFIKAGAEVDILDDGTLDLPDELLEQLDWVCAAIHTRLNKDNTDRLLIACEHPLVNCIAHPGGRLIGNRENYPVQWDKIFTVAARTGTAMEINAQPARMDLSDELARQAKEAGVKLVIGTDSHAENQFQYMKAGVALARRAWCTAEDILNTQHWKSLSEFRSKKMKRKSKEHRLKWLKKELGE